MLNFIKEPWKNTDLLLIIHKNKNNIMNNYTNSLTKIKVIISENTYLLY